jgi:branched-chain amino acid aminotransferase
MGARTHAGWAGTSVFDGARAFEGVTPDLAAHCTRINRSALALGLRPLVAPATWMGLVAEGLRKFPPEAELYIRPLYWAERNGPGSVPPDPDSTEWCLTLYQAPLPAPSGFAITLSPFRRPTPDTAPLDAKAGCLYPNNARAMVEARARGFDNCLLCDALGQVAELATANIFLVRDGVIMTPAPNGTFLDGITRQRVIRLLRDTGHTVVETSLRYADFLNADEIFATGNYAKVVPVTRIDERVLPHGPMGRRARALYWQFARSSGTIELPTTPPSVTPVPEAQPAAALAD